MPGGSRAQCQSPSTWRMHGAGGHHPGAASSGRYCLASAMWDTCVQFSTYPVVWRRGWRRQRAPQVLAFHQVPVVRRAAFEGQRGRDVGQVHCSHAVQLQTWKGGIISNGPAAPAHTACPSLCRASKARHTSSCFPVGQRREQEGAENTKGADTSPILEHSRKRTSIIVCLKQA